MSITTSAFCLIDCGKLGPLSIGRSLPMLVPREVYSSNAFAVSQFSLDSLYLAFIIAQFLILITIHLPIHHIHILVTDWVCPFCDAISEYCPLDWVCPFSDAISENCPLPDYKKALLFSGKKLRFSQYFSCRIMFHLY